MQYLGIPSVIGERLCSLMRPKEGERVLLEDFVQVISTIFLGSFEEQI